MFIKTRFTPLKPEKLQNHAFNFALDEQVKKKLKRLIGEQKKPDAVVSFIFRVVRNIRVAMFLI